MLVTSLLKLAQPEMTSKHAAIKEFMLRLELSQDLFIHAMAAGTRSLTQSSSATPATARPSRSPTRWTSTTP
jgi:hypothetical protein